MLDANSFILSFTLIRIFKVWEMLIYSGYAMAQRVTISHPLINAEAWVG